MTTNELAGRAAVRGRCAAGRQPGVADLTVTSRPRGHDGFTIREPAGWPGSSAPSVRGAARSGRVDLDLAVIDAGIDNEARVSHGLTGDFGAGDCSSFEVKQKPFEPCRR